MLAEEVRARRPFGGNVRGWLRDNIELIEGLQAGVWQPVREPGAPSLFVRPGRWQTDDIRLALIEAGVRYQNGSLTIHTLNSELRDVRREFALARAVEGGQPDVLARYVVRPRLGSGPGRTADAPVAGRAAPVLPLLAEQEPQAPRPSAQPSQPPGSTAGPPRVVPAWKSLGGDPTQSPGPSPSEKYAERLRRLVDGGGEEDRGKP